MSRRALRIVFAGPFPPPSGGAENFSVDVLGELARRGHSVDVTAAVAECDQAAAEAFAAGRPELTVRRFVMPYTEIGDLPPSPEFRRREARLITGQLAQALHAGPPDLVIAGREAVAPHLAALPYPKLLIVHGTRLWGVVRGTIPPELAAPLLAAMRRFHRIVTPGRHTAEQLAALGVPGAVVIPNPVDTERFRPRAPLPEECAALGLREADIVVLHASKLTEQKRPLDIVAAAARALGREPRLCFVIAGDGRLREEMQLACREHGVADRFRFLGRVPHERMPGLMSAAAMVVMPSAFECQALVYLEALASGRPLIASDIPAAREVMSDGVDGLLHGEGDVAGLTEAILRCAGDPGLRASLGAHGRDTAGRHSLPVVVDAYERVMLELAPASSSA